VSFWRLITVLLCYFAKRPLEFPIPIGSGTNWWVIVTLLLADLLPDFKQVKLKEVQKAYG